MNTEKQIAEFDIEKRYAMEPLDELEQYRLGVLLDGGLKLSKLIIDICPPSRDRIKALDRLQEAIMWAINASKD